MSLDCSGTVIHGAEHSWGAGGPQTNAPQQWHGAGTYVGSVTLSPVPYRGDDELSVAAAQISTDLGEYHVLGPNCHTWTSAFSTWMGGRCLEDRFSTWWVNLPSAVGSFLGLLSMLDDDDGELIGDA